MVPLCETYIHLKVQASDAELELLNKYFLGLSKFFAPDIYRINAVETLCEITRGSVKIRVIVLGTIVNLAMHYGSVRSSIDYLVEDAKKFGEKITSTFLDDTNIEAKKIIRIEKRLGLPGQLKKLFDKIDELEEKKSTAAEIQEMRRTLKKIVSAIDSEQDRIYLETHLPKKYLSVKDTLSSGEPLYFSALKSGHTLQTLLNSPSSSPPSDGTFDEFSKRYLKGQLPSQGYTGP